MSRGKLARRFGVRGGGGGRPRVRQKVGSRKAALASKLMTLKPGLQRMMTEEQPEAPAPPVAVAWAAAASDERSIRCIADHLFAGVTAGN